MQYNIKADANTLVQIKAKEKKKQINQLYFTNIMSRLLDLVLICYFFILFENRKKRYVDS